MMFVIIVGPAYTANELRFSDMFVYTLRRLMFHSVDFHMFM